MKNFCQKRRVRTLALVLFCLCLVGSFAYGFLYNYGLQDGWYSGKVMGFEKSSLCRSYIEDCLDFVSTNLQWQQDPTDTTLGSHGGDSFAYTIQTSEGVIVADTTTEDSVYVMDYNNGSYGTSVILLAVDDGEADILYDGEYMSASETDVAAAETDGDVYDPEEDTSVAAAEPEVTAYPTVSEENGAAATPPPVPTAMTTEETDATVYAPETADEDWEIEEIISVYSYTISGYVNLPVNPYDGCYSEYFIFTHLYAGRNCYLAVCVGCGILALMALALALAGAVLAGKNGEQPVKLCRLPFDVMALGLYLCAFVLWVSMWNWISYVSIRHTGIWVSFSLIKTIFLLMAAGLGGYVLAAQLAAKIFLHNLLLCRLGRKLLTTPVLRALLVIFLGVQCFWTYGWYSPVCALLLTVADLVLLGLFGRWVKEGKDVQAASAALAAGNLTYKVNTGKLHMAWKPLGRDLNSIGDGMALAVEERMRSERLKTELITNVSHDLKTPLTSIINYIDLLKDENLPADKRREYVAVLERQGAKLKKLTEDVVEASKAVSGAIEVNWEELDVTELLEQSVGEYSERLQEAKIEPVIHVPQESVLLLADGRLLGRVLDNLVTNILKYAQPGTRAYFDLSVRQEKLEIAIKNISKAPLDIPAEELMERFVRGDSSRSSEGSGLGLSIALSLTKLMGGALELILDGDLFKALITFPSVARIPREEELPALMGISEEE